MKKKVFLNSISFHDLKRKKKTSWQPKKRSELLFFFFLTSLLEYNCFTMLCQFLLYSEVNQLYVYIYPLFFVFPSHIGHQRTLSRVPYAIQQVLISYLFYTYYCIHVNPNLPIHPTPCFPSWCPYFCSLCLCLYFCLANRFISWSTWEQYLLELIVWFSGRGL